MSRPLEAAARQAVATLAKDALMAIVSDVGTKRQQSVELGGIITDTVGPGDEDLPALFRKSPPLRDGDDNAQPNRRGGILTP
jgi:hypothetical protein